jgi:hypothetical protein
MRYIIADKVKAVAYGFELHGHRVNGNLILLNEKEMECNPALASAPTLEKKCELILGSIYTHQDIINELEQGGWNNG